MHCRILLALLLLATLCSCAQTTIKTSTVDGRPVKVSTSADARDGFYASVGQGGEVVVIAGSLDHTTPTTARAEGVASIGRQVLAILDRYMLFKWLMNTSDNDAAVANANTQAGVDKAGIEATTEVTKAEFQLQENLAKLEQP